MPNLMACTINGECRFLAHADYSVTDEQGFPGLPYEARTETFLKCSWSVKTNARNDSSEKVVANQTRAAFVYEFTVSQTIDGAAVVCEPSDRLEMKFKPDGEIQSLEIISIVNQMNVAWLVYAIDIEE